MKRINPHLRNLAITALVLIFVLVVAGYDLPTSAAPVPPSPTQGAALAPLQQAVGALSTNDATNSGIPGSTVTYDVILRNTGTVSGTFNISIATSCNVDIPGCNEGLGQTVIVLNPGAQVTFQVFVNLPANATPGATARTVVRATLAAGGGQANLLLTTTVIAPTPTQTGTPPPTTTPLPLCQDGFEPDNNPSQARQIDVNTIQEHTICPQGDEDWLFFGAIAGRVYTIDIIRMDPGIDLTLELFDAQGRSLNFNDDYYNRGDTPNPNDIRPRIDSFRIPADGRYYIRVRDNAGRGGINYFYTITLIAEGTGPTPTTVAQICIDLFEQDGLPEQARLITSNELQQNRRLCPSGDADWVTFFGATGKRYIIFTDTRPYRGQNEVNPGTQAGADTVMVLTDRDGVSILDFNDDIPGGNTLDSQIEFTPSIDGFYFLQVKNVGDIGNQFIAYDLILQLCLPGQTDCGRSANPPNRELPEFPAPTVGTPFTLPTPSRTPTPTNTPVALVGQADGFADLSFRQVWQRSDLSVASQRVSRSWMWGPAGLEIRQEAYAQSATGTRLVQYFDKARMEINNPTGDRSSPWFVTNGLLVRELISGQMQVGDNQFEARQPANVVIAGDVDDPSAPTYATFKGILGIRFNDRTGQDVRELLDRSGDITEYRGPTRAEARLVRFVPETNHNIPAVFWQFLNAQGEIYEQGRYTTGTLTNWVSAMGYPVSEPYWVRVRVGGVERDVMVQAFERRVLTYTPDNPPGWQVEMGNVGQHYYEWRYGTPLR